MDHATQYLNCRALARVSERFNLHGKSALFRMTDPLPIEDEASGPNMGEAALFSSVNIAEWRLSMLDKY
jgi:hypothetical protein